MSSLRQTSNIEPLQLHHRLPFDLKFFLDPVPPSKQPHFVCSPASSPKSLMPAAQEPPTTHVHPNNLRNALPPHAGLRQATGNLGGPAFAPSFFDLSGAHRTSSMPLLAPAPPRYANHVQVYKRRARWVERPAPSRVGGVTPPPSPRPSPHSSGDESTRRWVFRPVDRLVLFATSSPMVSDMLSSIHSALTDPH